MPPPPPGTRGLERTIEDVCRRAPGVLPCQTYSPAAGAWWPGGLVALTQRIQADPPPVGLLMRQRLLSVLASFPMGDGNRIRNALNGMTVRQFRILNTHGQLQFINTLWNAVTTPHAFTAAANTMLDPIYNVPPSNQAPLPSSWCPVNVGAGNHHKRLTGKQPFRQYSVGFRVEGSVNDITRVMNSGMLQQRLSQGFMHNHRGLYLDGTVAADPTTARVWSGNDDLFNESAVCVSRNFFGATAFPERTTDHSGSQFAVLWAVDCGGLNGFDTEQHQVNLAGNRQWRPGEKAFREIPVQRILGWVPIIRRGAPQTGGWKFDVDLAANWTILGSPSVRQRVYMMDELNAWRGRHIIPGAYDFAH